MGLNKDKWSELEHSVIKAMWANQNSIKAIGKALNRSKSAVSHRITWLGIDRSLNMPPPVESPPVDPWLGAPDYEDDPRATAEFNALPRAPVGDVTALLMGDPNPEIRLFAEYPAKIPVPGELPVILLPSPGSSTPGDGSF